MMEGMTLNPSRTRRLTLSLAFSLALAVPGALAATYTVATVSPLSGSQAPLGTELKRGTELAFKAHAAELSKLGLNVKLKFFDDQASADVGSKLAKTILADASIVGVVGAINSSVSNVLGAAFAPQDLAVISSSSTNDALTRHGWKNFTRTVAPDHAQALAAGQYFQEVLHAGGVYVVSDNTAYGNGLTKGVMADLKTRNVKVLSYAGVSISGDNASLVERIKASGAKFIYFGGSDDKGASLLGSLRAAGVKAVFMGGDGLDTPSFLKRMGANAPGVLYTTVYGPVNSFSNYLDFVQAYRAAYGSEQPNGVSAYSYDAAMVLIEAMKSLAAAGKAVTRASVSQAVQHVNLSACFAVDKASCPTITGAVGFTASGERLKSRVLMMSYDEMFQPKIMKIVSVDGNDLN